MDSIDWKAFWEKLKDIYIKQDKNTDSYDKEIKIVKEVLEKINRDLKNDFEFLKPIGRGGAGIVIELIDKRLELERALKIPRPTTPEQIDSIKREIRYLKEIKHENIICLHYLGEVYSEKTGQQYPYFVMDYIKDAKDIREVVLKKALKVDGRRSLKLLTRWVAQSFFRIANAIQFLHDNEIIHFDIKPSNILIDKTENPVLSDLGFAKKKTSQTEEVVVGFTLFYAHPDLKLSYSSMSSKNRVRKAMAPNAFKYIFDIYAFGKSLLEILTIIDAEVQDIVVYDYNFVYLHLAACRMLDGKNLSRIETDRIRKIQLQDGKLSIYRETWEELNEAGFKEIKYQNIKEITNDFEKLLIGKHFLDSVDELNYFFPKKVHISDGGGAPFSKRVKLIVEHPVFARLGMVPQLGLLSATYPTATHNRLEHSIGVFRNCCLYIQSLYNDPYNPLFKQLINEEDIKCGLLASLLHDIGQYPLAHEIEEIGNVMKHEEIGTLFLENPILDAGGRTLKEIIINDDYGWGVEIERLKSIIFPDKLQGNLFSREDYKIKMMRSLINGPIDADKLDYLIRDSKNCFLKYGDLIDFERLVRNLTIMISQEDNKIESLNIGVYEKGQSAAESITFARYLLYQALYWHRTSRSIRAMLKRAIMTGFSARSKGRFKTFYDELKDVLGVDKYPNKIDLYKILDLIENWVSDEGVDLIKMIKNRQYFKRILTIHDERDSQYFALGKRTLLEKFIELQKSTTFQMDLQKEIKKAFLNVVAHTEPKVTYFSSGRIDEIAEKLDKEGTILCDCPKPSYGAKNHSLNIIPEPQRLHKNYFYRLETGKRASEVWFQVHHRLMNIAAKGRIFCHPDIREMLMTALGLNQIKKIVEKMLD